MSSTSDIRAGGAYVELYAEDSRLQHDLGRIATHLTGLVGVTRMAFSAAAVYMASVNLESARMHRQGVPLNRESAYKVDSGLTRAACHWFGSWDAALPLIAAVWTYEKRVGLSRAIMRGDHGRPLAHVEFHDLPPLGLGEFLIPPPRSAFDAVGLVNREGSADEEDVFPVEVAIVTQVVRIPAAHVGVIVIAPDER